jgi:hypothetical protein
MSRAWAGVLAVLALVLSACAAPARPPLDRITGACQLLLTVEAGIYLDPGLVPVEHNFGGADETLYVCDYNRDDKTVFGLIVREFPSQGLGPADLINSIGRRGRVRTTPVAGVGEAAAYFEPEPGFAAFAAAKKSGPNLRAISMSAPEPFSSNRFAVLAAIVMARL